VQYYLIVQLNRFPDSVSIWVLNVAYAELGIARKAVPVSIIAYRAKPKMLVEP
jgi:hypothetical protein